MISGVTKVNLTCRRSQTDLLCEAAFCVEHQAPNIGLWSDNLTLATSEPLKLPHSTGEAWPHSGRSPAGTPGPGSHVPESARSIHHFETTYLTPTDGLQDAVGLESWGSLNSKALIKLEKTREEPKSSAAGERKEPMLKSKSLL